MGDNHGSVFGVNFISLLQLAFIVLKLCKVISWKWVLVLLPFEIIGAMLFVCVVLLVVLENEKTRMSDVRAEE